MNKFLITTISAAGTLGTAGAAFAGVNVVEQFTSPDTTSTATTMVDSEVDSAERTVAYQIGAAGTVTVTLHDGELTVVDVVAADGWSVIGASAPGQHVEVQLTDGAQVVTFGADIVGADIAVTVTSAPATTDPTSPDTTVPGIFDVTIISDVPDDDGLRPYPGNPGVGTPTTTVPSSSTTAPSGGEYEDEHEDESEDESEDEEHESEDHESEDHHDEVEHDD